MVTDKPKSPHVEICYQLRGSTQLSELTIPADEYYEPTDDQIEWDSVPRHDHAIDYLPNERSEMAQTIILLYSADGQLCCKLREVFWNHGRNRLIERVDNEGALFILELSEDGSDEPTHVIRYDGTPDDGSIVEHFISRDGESKTLLSQLLPDP